MRVGKYCRTQPFLGPFGEVWDWVGKAKFVGTVKVDGNRFDVWNYTVSYSVLYNIYYHLYSRKVHIHSLYG